MTCVEGNLRKVMFNGKNECLFKVPNFCICDPLFERDYDSIKDQFKNKKEININIVCFYMQKNIVVHPIQITMTIEKSSLIKKVIILWVNVYMLEDKILQAVKV